MARRVRLIDIIRKHENVPGPEPLNDEVFALNAGEEGPHQVLGDMTCLSRAGDVGLNACSSRIPRLEDESSQTALPIEDRQTLHEKLPAVAELQLGVVLIGNLE